MTAFVDAVRESGSRSEWAHVFCLRTQKAPRSYRPPSGFQPLAARTGWARSDSRCISRRPDVDARRRHFRRCYSPVQGIHLRPAQWLLSRFRRFTFAKGDQMEHTGLAGESRAGSPPWVPTDRARPPRSTGPPARSGCGHACPWRCSRESRQGGRDVGCEAPHLEHARQSKTTAGVRNGRRSFPSARWRPMPGCEGGGIVRGSPGAWDRSLISNCRSRALRDPPRRQVPPRGKALAVGRLRSGNCYGYLLAD